MSCRNRRRTPPLGRNQSAKSGRKKSTQLGDFILKKKLGQGGMGAVFLGHQISLDRPCAVKVLSKALAEKPGFKDRFLREARAMAKIEHPAVVACYAVGEDQGHNYVAMELIDGQSGQDWLNQLERFSVPDALLIAVSAAEALEHAHRLKMIHRDVKPDNILITQKGVIKVSDMGLAKATDDEDMSMTQSGTGLGTPHYMPPEQARNAKHVDHRCDIYALGCTLYHMVTGKLPFAGETIVDLITNKEKGAFKAAKRLNSEVPERLDLIIDKMMSKDLTHRYGSMQEVIDDLEKLNLTAPALSFIDHPEKGRSAAQLFALDGHDDGGLHPGDPPAETSPCRPEDVLRRCTVASRRRVERSELVHQADRQHRQDQSGEDVERPDPDRHQDGQTRPAGSGGRECQRPVSAAGADSGL